MKIMLKRASRGVVSLMPATPFLCVVVYGVLRFLNKLP